jgi:uncharacterized integral membrane protein
MRAVFQGRQGAARAHQQAGANQPGEEERRSQNLNFIKTILGFIVILALLVFVLSNRVPVALSLWPFGLVLSLWLGPVLVGTLVAGFLLGLLFHLPARFSAHRRARRAEKRLAELQPPA